MRQTHADVEQHVLAFIRARLEAGDTQRRIVAALNNRLGWHPRRSETWTQQKLSTVIRRVNGCTERGHRAKLSTT